MKRPKLEWTSGIRARILLLAVIPLLAIALVIGGYTVHVRLADARQGLDERGGIIAANLAMAAELALLTRNLDRLQRLCQATLQQPDVVWAGVRDSTGTRLAQTVRSVATAEDARNAYRAAIGMTGVPVEDFRGDAEDDPPQPLGWAEVELSLAGTLARQRQIQMTSLLIIGGGLLISLLAAWRIGAGISRPLVDLSRAMSRYREGEHAVRIATAAGGEIGELARDFNRMAQELERSQSGLREQVSAATAELQRTIEALSAKNIELEEAREEAVRAGKEKHEFLARMSHEIRTPLNAVIGFSRLLLSSEASPEGVLEYTRTIDWAANQLLTVIDGVLNFTKLEAGSLELEHLVFDLRACLEDVVAMLSPTAHAKGLELALVMHQDIPETLTGDPNRIAEVLVNLLDNAVKFTAEGHVLVEASYVDDRVRIDVTDTGVGLSAQERKRLFQPFTQADSSVTRRFGGTGLGLVISKRLVELMGGSMGLESEPGKGSRFYFTLPCGVAPQGVRAPASSPLAGLKILVYDKQQVQLRALRTALLGWSMQVFNTMHREQIPVMLNNAAVRGEPFDLLILGLGPDESNRNSFDRLMAEIGPFFAGRLLVLVGTEHWDLPESAWGLGEVDWAAKPLRRSLLHRCLCRLVGRVGGHLDRPEQPQAAPTDLAGRRVLVVEDNAFNRLLLRRLLERRGIEATEACDGPEAIAAARGDGYDLILMDIHMPGMDGFETARRIRAQAGAEPCPPILALSADVFAQDPATSQQREFDGFLLKPISEPALDDAIRRVLEPGGRPEPFPPQNGPATAFPSIGILPAGWGERLQRETDALCDRLEVAISSDDREAIRELAHGLKGLCGFFERRDLEAAVRALEAAALNEGLAELRERVQRLRHHKIESTPETDQDRDAPACDPLGRT